MSERVTAKTVAAWRAAEMPWPEIHSRIAAARISSAQLREWFEEALDRDGRRPSPEAYEQLAADIAQLREAGWPDALQEEQEKRRLKAERSAEQLRADIESWAELSGGFPGHYLDTIGDMLASVGVRAVGHEPPKPPRGRGRAQWHKYGRKFAELIEGSLRDAGYTGRTKAADWESATAEIGAKLVNETFDLPKPLEPSGFASAMRTRDQRKRRDLGMPVRY